MIEKFLGHRLPGTGDLYIRDAVTRPAALTEQKLREEERFRKVKPRQRASCKIKGLQGAWADGGNDYISVSEHDVARERIRPDECKMQCIGHDINAMAKQFALPTSEERRGGPVGTAPPLPRSGLFGFRIGFRNGCHLSIGVDLSLDHITHMHLLAHFRGQRNGHLIILKIPDDVSFTASGSSCCRSLIPTQFTPHGVGCAGPHKFRTCIPQSGRGDPVPCAYNERFL